MKKVRYHWEDFFNRFEMANFCRWLKRDGLDYTVSKIGDGSWLVEWFE